MGSFFTNIHVRHADQKSVMALISTIDGLSPAYVTKAENGWVTVFPESTDRQEYNVLVELTKALSTSLGTAALGTLGHDSDIFKYVLCDKGAVLDEYDSCPGYFSGSGKSGHSGGNPELLAKFASPAHSKADDFAKALGGKFTFSDEQVVMVTSLLGIDARGATIGYTYAAQGDYEGSLQHVREKKAAVDTKRSTGTLTKRRIGVAVATPTSVNEALCVLAPKKQPVYNLNQPEAPNADLLEAARAIIRNQSSEVQIDSLDWTAFVTNRLQRSNITMLDQLLKLNRTDLIAMGKTLSEQFADEVTKNLCDLGLQLEQS